MMFVLLRSFSRCLTRLTPAFLQPRQRACQHHHGATCCGVTTSRQDSAGTSTARNSSYIMWDGGPETEFKLDHVTHSYASPRLSRYLSDCRVSGCITAGQCCAHKLACEEDGVDKERKRTIIWTHEDGGERKDKSNATAEAFPRGERKSSNVNKNAEPL